MLSAKENRNFYIKCSWCIIYGMLTENSTIVVSHFCHGRCELRLQLQSKWWPQLRQQMLSQSVHYDWAANVGQAHLRTKELIAVATSALKIEYTQLIPNQSLHITCHFYWLFARIMLDWKLHKCNSDSALTLLYLW